MADLNHDKIATYRNDKDRKMELSIGVYMGGASLTVFGAERQGGPLAKFPVPADMTVLLGRWLRQMITAEPGTKRSAKITKWNNEAKKAETIGTVVVGRDDEGVYIGIASSKMQPAKFPIRFGMAWDVSSEYAGKTEESLEATEALITALNTDVRMARMLTSFKREGGFGGKPGGGFGGGGGRGGAPAMDDSMLF